MSDIYDGDSADPLIDPAMVQAILEQPVDIIITEGAPGVMSTFSSAGSVDPGVAKAWAPDDEVIAQARIDSEDVPKGFVDPVEQVIINGSAS